VAKARPPAAWTPLYCTKLLSRREIRRPSWTATSPTSSLKQSPPLLQALVPRQSSSGSTHRTIRPVDRSSSSVGSTIVVTATLPPQLGSAKLLPPREILPIIRTATSPT